MLACLPAPAHSATSLLSLQMNTGPPRWATTQKMRSPAYPSPAELDAYAKKVANNPLTIQIFPNSVKVPQRKHVRRTVNGLDTSSQRHSPYSTQLSATAGLLAVLRVPVKQPTATRTRGPQKATMNLHSGPYGPQSTLNSAHMQGPSQAPVTHAMNVQHTLPQTAPHPPALQHKGLSHPGLLQRQQSLSQLPTAQRSAYPHGLQRQLSVPLPQQCVPPGQHAPLPHTLRHHDPNPPNPPPNAHRSGPRTALGLQTQELHHMSQLNMTHPQTLPQNVSSVVAPTVQQPEGPQPLGGPQTGVPQPGGVHPARTRASQPGPSRGPPPGILGPQPRPLRAPQPGPTGVLHSTPAGLQPGGLQTELGGPHPCPPGSQQGPPRGTLPDPPGGAPFMGDSVQQPTVGPFGPRKLPDADAPPNVTVSTSTIPLSMAGSLHQSRAGDLSSIVLQINQLCQARAGLGGTSVCEGQIANPSPISRNLLINASSRVAHPPAQGPMQSFHMTAGPDKGHPPDLPLTSQPSIGAPNGLQSFHSEVEKGQSLMQRSWAQHQLAHIQQPPEGAHPCKMPRLETPADCSFASPQNLSYTHKVPSSAQAFPLKHQDKFRSSPPLCSGTSQPYMDSQYLQQSWGPSQEASGLQGTRAGSSERFPAQKYKQGKDESGIQPKLMPNMDFLPRNFQVPRYGEPSVDMRSSRQDSGPGVPLPGHHPGYR